MAARVTPQQIAQLARARGLDPRAVLAVARQEGLGGGIGDGGHAYGPFQLNNAGGVISNLYGGRVNDPSVQDWAWSPQGVGYALDRISGVAKGLTGRQAVNAIVSRFERPANPGREIAGALAAYGGTQGAPNSFGSPSGAASYQPGAAAPPVQPPAVSRSQLAQSLLSSSSGGDYSGFFQKVAQARAAAAAPAASAPLTTQEHLPALAGNPTLGAKIAQTALTQIGKPYQWGGQATLGHATDCSGLLQASAAANGVHIGRTTYQQYKQGTPVPLNQLQPGDAVFFHPGPNGPEHVAIYIGGGRVVEDPHTGATVEISQLAGRGPVGARRYG